MSRERRSYSGTVRIRQQPQMVMMKVPLTKVGAIFQLQLDARMSNSLPIVQIVKILDWERLQEMSWNTWVSLQRSGDQEIDGQLAGAGLSL